MFYIFDNDFYLDYFHFYPKIAQIQMYLFQWIRLYRQYLVDIIVLLNFDFYNMSDNQYQIIFLCQKQTNWIKRFSRRPSRENIGKWPPPS